MKKLTLQEGVISTGENAFFRCTALIMSVVQGTYAEQYADENRIAKRVATA